MRNLTRISLFVGVLLALGAQQANAQLRSAPLTAAEKEWITLIRIDEKLARDVYLKLYDVWGVPIFANIAASEQNHMDAVARLITKYGLTDPVAGLGVGEFPENIVIFGKVHDFQGLYDMLVTLGTQSVEDAYMVGVLIEELDIDDLENALLAVKKTDIKNVFTNLWEGSIRHLAAFESHL